MTDAVSRRSLFKTAGAVGVAAAIPGTPAEAAPQQQPPVSPQQSTTHQSGTFYFLNGNEARFLHAAVDRLIPADDQWQGAAWAGVVNYIDRQLASAYGAGARLYLRGPWQEGEPQQGYQLRYTPAELYRVGIDEIRKQVRDSYNGKEFWDIGETAMDDVLRRLEADEIELASMPGSVFFETLLANTIEGFFSDPAYGGNRDMVSWRMVGFPGAYAQYVELVDQYDVAFTRPPMSIAQAEHHPMQMQKAEKQDLQKAEKQD